MILPRAIKRLDETAIEISWQDGSVDVLASKVLRENCPAADSREKRAEIVHSKPLSPSTGRSILKVVSHSLDEELKLKKIEPVGNYALRLTWGDGHNSGIYTFELLKSLGQKKTAYTVYKK